MKKPQREYAVVLAVVILFYLAGMAVGITCPILELTGISCPGCGMTRAWLCVLHGDAAGAFSYHPLFLLPVVLAVLWLVRRRIPPKWMNRLVLALLLLTLFVWLLRFFLPNDPAARFDPVNGRILQILLK